MTIKDYYKKPIRFDKTSDGWLFSAVDICVALNKKKISDPVKYWTDVKKVLYDEDNTIARNCHEINIKNNDGSISGIDMLSSQFALKLANYIMPNQLIRFQIWIETVIAIKYKYILKHKKINVIEFEVDEKGRIVELGRIFNPNHLPVASLNSDKPDLLVVKQWWGSRSIPASREALNNLLDTLGLEFPQQLILKSFGLSLSDQYWICPEGIELDWEDINFFQNGFSDDIGNLLFDRGDNLSINNISLISPDNTSDGILKKSWKIINNKRYLIKAGRSPLKQEPLNEVLASRICQRLQIPYVNYDIIKIDHETCSRCEDFITEKTELVTAWHIIEHIKKDNNISLYTAFIKKCEELGIPDVRLRIDQMITLDFIIANTDRHYNNFGFVRDADTLEWIGFAPIYDSGTSMWCNEINEINPNSQKLSSKPFRNKHFRQIELVQNFSWFNIDALNGIEKEYADILAMNSKKYEFTIKRNQQLCNALLTRINLLGKIIDRSNKIT
ncbi:MAG: HipA domain-containing protein [Christensenellaceae bacterium]|jgi:hypothetical protein|nr:HipA domain-containing protein [Christensenellaceae bacterium]